MTDSTDFLRRQLYTLRQTARYLLEKAANVGGEVQLDPKDRHSLDEVRRDIAACKASLRAAGVLVDDLPEDTAPPVVAPAVQGRQVPQNTYAPHVVATNMDSAGNGGVQGAVYGSVTFNQATPPVSHPPATPGPQLRPPTKDFVGRDGVLAEIVTALQPEAGSSGAVISGVRGMGGIGKTELALAVAARLRDIYTDGQILLDLLGSSETPLDAVQALQRVIRVFRPEDKLPDDLPALEALYHTTLSGRRVLILADDAHTAAQVRPLTPPHGCALLITTRLRFALDGMAPFDLEALPEPAAITLLRRICQRLTEEQARRIAALCGRLPLALRISGGILLNDPALAVERYLRDLENERTRLAQLKDPDDPARDVEAVLRVSYAKLDGQTQTIFRRLGVIGADADLALLSDVLVVPEKELDELLRKLLRRYLVEYDQKTGRWGMHALVRVYALGRLTAAGADKERAARMRYAKRVLAIIAQANLRYKAGRNGVLEGLSRFDQERAHLEAVRTWLWAQVPSAEIDVLVMVEANAAVHLGGLRDSLRAVRVPQLERAVGAARRRRDRATEGIFLGNLGNAYSRLGEVRRAIKLYEQALAIAHELGDRHGEGSALGNLGLAYSHLGEVRRAIELHEQALAIARELGDRHGEGTALGNLGGAYAPLGEVQRAIEYLEQHLTIARELGDRRSEGNALGNLGVAYKELGEMQRAIDLYKLQLAITRELGDRAGEGSALGNLGSAYYSLGEVRRAIELYDQHLAIARELGDRHGEGTALSNLGCVYFALGDVLQAIKLHEQHLTIARERGDQIGEGSALSNLGDAYTSLGEVRRVIDFYEQALAITRKLGDRRTEGTMLGNLGNAYYNLGEARRAIELFEQCLAIARELGDQSSEGSMLGSLGVAYSNQGEVRRAILLHEQHLAITREVGDRQGKGVAMGNLGFAYYSLGELRQAIELYEQHLVITREVGDQHSEGIAMGNLGVVYADLGDPAQALRRYDEALQLLRTAGDRQNQSYVLNQIGRAHLYQGNPDEALTQSRAALTLARDTGNRRVEGMTLRTIAAAHAALGQPAEAEANFAASLAVLEAIEHVPELARTRWDYGLFLVRQGERERGIDLMAQCVAYEQRIGHAKAAEHAAEVERLRQEET
ncbi:MAG: hypothetical protein OHK0022_55230 [Roseiflexaceae bacterium]